MNKTVVFITFAFLVIVSIAGTFLLLIFAPQHFGTFTGFILVLLGLASTFAATVWSLGKTKQETANVKEELSTKLDVVQRQTNGTLTKLLERLHEKDEAIRKRDRHIADLEAALLNRPKGATND